MHEIQKQQALKINREIPFCHHPGKPTEMPRLRPCSSGHGGRRRVHHACGPDVEDGKDGPEVIYSFSQALSNH